MDKCCVLAPISQTPVDSVWVLPDLPYYFLRPTERFLSLRSEDLHFLHLSACSGFLAPHLKHTWRNRRLFWAICFLVASAMGNRTYLSGIAVPMTTKNLSARWRRLCPSTRVVHGLGGVRDSEKPFISALRVALLENEYRIQSKKCN
jgi:hypothetical protein